MVVSEIESLSRDGNDQFRTGVNRKAVVNLLLVMLLVSVAFVSDVRYTHPEPTDVNEGGYNRKSEVRLASWNIRGLSDNSRDNTGLHQIAQTRLDYDFIIHLQTRG